MYIIIYISFRVCIFCELLVSYHTGLLLGHDQGVAYCIPDWSSGNEEKEEMRKMRKDMQQMTEMMKVMQEKLDKQGRVPP